VSFNTKELVHDCLASIYETVEGEAFEVWLVDNHSTDGTAASAEKDFPAVNIIRNSKNLGFAAANNQALKRMKGRYALLLNSDAVLTRGAVKELYDFMEHRAGVAMACGQLLNDDGSKQNSMSNFPTLLSLASNETILRTLMPQKYPSKRRDYMLPLPVDSCIGACVMVRKRAIQDIGFLDERYFFFLEETDWAYRMKRSGWEVYFVPTAKIIHRQGKTVGHGIHSRVLFYRSRYSFFKKWHPRSFPVFYSVIFLRLFINSVLAFVGLSLTLGLKASTRRKLVVNSQLLKWHLRGCSEQRRN